MFKRSLFIITFITFPMIGSEGSLKINVVQRLEHILETNDELKDMNLNDFFESLEADRYNIDYTKFIDSDLNTEIDNFINEHSDTLSKMKINKKIFVAQLVVNGVVKLEGIEIKPRIIKGILTPGGWYGISIKRGNKDFVIDGPIFLPVFRSVEELKEREKKWYRNLTLQFLQALNDKQILYLLETYELVLSLTVRFYSSLYQIQQHLNIVPEVDYRKMRLALDIINYSIFIDKELSQFLDTLYEEYADQLLFEIGIAKNTFIKILVGNDIRRKEDIRVIQISDPLDKNSEFKIKIISHNKTFEISKLEECDYINNINAEFSKKLRDEEILKLYNFIIRNYNVYE